MANKIDEYGFTTDLTIREVEKRLNQAFAKMGVEHRASCKGLLRI